MCSLHRQEENCHETGSPGALWAPLFPHRDVFMAACGPWKSWGLTDVTHISLISLFHREPSLHNHGFCASLPAPKWPQLVRNFYHVHQGKPLPQPLMPSTKEGKSCTSVSQMWKWKHQAILKGGFTIRNFPPFTSHIRGKKENLWIKKGSFLLSYTEGQKAASAPNLDVFASFQITAQTNCSQF